MWYLVCFELAEVEYKEGAEPGSSPTNLDPKEIAAAYETLRLDMEKLPTSVRLENISQTQRRTGERVQHQAMWFIEEVSGKKLRKLFKMLRERLELGEQDLMFVVECRQPLKRIVGKGPSPPFDSRENFRDLFD